jgi:hydrogenase-4 component E
VAQAAASLLILAVVMNFLAIGTASLRACIRAAALQGFLVSVFALIFTGVTVRLALLVLVAAIIKAFVIPSMLFRALREVHIRHEMVFADNLPLAREHHELLVVPAALSTMFAGFLLLTTRRKAISQVTGYLVLENGIFVFAQLLHEAMPFLVEVGVLLDLIVGIFVMGIVINHIQREFSSLDTERLTVLKD